MWIAGAGMGLGARLMVEVDARSFRGYRPLRNENPRMGVRGWIGGGGWIGGIGLLTKEEVLRLLAHRHAVRPCQRGQGTIQAAEDEPLTHSVADHLVPSVLPMHCLASQHRLFDLL
jgi:hypothetical protein